MTQEASDLHYSDTPGGLQDSDFIGTNGYLNATQYKAAILTLTNLDAQCANMQETNPSVYTILRQLKS